MQYRYVTNGKLKILLYNDDIQRWIEQANMYAMQLEEDIKSGMYSGRLQPSDYITETNRLLAIANRIIAMPEIFDYIPLTKAGLMPLNRNILIADSKCEVVRNYDNNAVSINKLQLRLTDCYLTEEEIRTGKRSNLAKSLEIRMYNITGKQQPVIDEYGRLNIIKTTKPTSYIKDKNIPGRVYTEKSGTNYLYLGKLSIQMTALYDTGKIDRYNPSVGYFYIRMTEKLKAKIQGIKDMNTLYRVLADMYKEISNGWVTKCSIRENPRKFIAESEVLIENQDIRADNFITKSINHDWDWKYIIMPA